MVLPEEDDSESSYSEPDVESISSTSEGNGRLSNSPPMDVDKAMRKKLLNKEDANVRKVSAFLSEIDLMAPSPYLKRILIL
jgi:hypothetical protein